MIGRRWDKEHYILGYKPKSKIMYDIGFNWAVGDKWRNKNWPQESWEELTLLLGNKYSIDRQRGLSNLYDYMDWINSCRLIITNDSLGMHLAMALRKKFIAFFGPSSSKEVYLYGLGKILTPEVDYKCIPCLSRECHQSKNCMYFITPQRVKSEVEKVL